MTNQERVNNYNLCSGYPLSLFVGGDNRIIGTWIMGNNYQAEASYYGSYPSGYLRRLKLLFPDKRVTLHLFSGKVNLSAFPGETVDINDRLLPTYVDDAQTLEKVPLEKYDLILADPPYSVEDAEHYKTTMINRNKVVETLSNRLQKGCHIVWLDQVLPMYSKIKLLMSGVIGMVKSTNHRFRVITIFEKL